MRKRGRRGFAASAAWRGCESATEDGEQAVLGVSVEEVR